MKDNNYPIVEFDDDEPLIRPSHFYENKGAPECCVLPFFNSVISRLKERGCLKQIAFQSSKTASVLPLYEMDINGERIAVMTPGITASFAAASLEFAIATGCRKFVACGTCGVLDASIERNAIVVPIDAIRDEGTSYHYAPPSRKILLDENAQEVVRKTLDEKGTPHFSGTTWTTDGFYRETRNRIDRRRKEGATVVEMEASALAAVAKYRGVRLGYLLVAADDVSGTAFDRRLEHKSTEAYEQLFWLAVEACSKL